MKRTTIRAALESKLTACDYLFEQILAGFPEKWALDHYRVIQGAAFDLSVEIERRRRADATLSH